MKRLLALYGNGEPQLARLRALLEAHQEIRVCADWKQYLASVSGAECAVLLIPWVHEKSASQIAELRRRHPRHPLVVVTSKDADNARRLQDLAVDEVVWVGEKENTLLAAVRRAIARGSLQCIARVLQSDNRLPTGLRKALVTACVSRTVVPTVCGLAATVGCDRRTLSRSWQACYGDSPCVRLEDFIDWVVLLRATFQKGCDQSWSRVAEGVGVHPQTLGRIAHRLTGNRLRELSAVTTDALVGQFVDSVLAPMLGASFRARAPGATNSSLPE